MKLKIFAIGILFLTLAACTSTSEPETIYLSGGNQQNVILLQDIDTGNIVCCRDTAHTTAEQCAQALEADCFVRIQDLPYRTAKYDFLTDNTYPTRRWREGETTPRW